MHAPRYMCTVEVDGKTYSCLNSFSNKKAAEQEAARLALEGLSEKIKDCTSKKMTEVGFPPIHQVQWKFIYFCLIFFILVRI